jgi:hypothetical protein
MIAVEIEAADAGSAPAIGRARPARAPMSDPWYDQQNALARTTRRIGFFGQTRLAAATAPQRASDSLITLTRSPCRARVEPMDV